MNFCNSAKIITALAGCFFKPKITLLLDKKLYIYMYSIAVDREAVLDLTQPIKIFCFINLPTKSFDFFNLFKYSKWLIFFSQT